MELASRFAVRAAWSGVLLMFALAAAPAALPQSSAQAPVAASAAENSTSATNLTSLTSSSKTTSDAEELPDSPGVTSARLQSSGLPQIAAAQQTDVPELPAPAKEDQSSAAPQQPTQRPVGTAAAPSFTTSGVAASQPSGVAIAPEKQRRVRTIVIRVGAIIAAGVAVGTVVGLTEATSSKPPGAH
jgi:cytoskeletal protein RodZ